MPCSAAAVAFSAFLKELYSYTTHPSRPRTTLAPGTGLWRALAEENREPKGGNEDGTPSAPHSEFFFDCCAFCGASPCQSAVRGACWSRILRASPVPSVVRGSFLRIARTPSLQHKIKTPSQDTELSKEVDGRRIICRARERAGAPAGAKTFPNFNLFRQEQHNAKDAET